jgi:hypothetical protein
MIEPTNATRAARAKAALEAYAAVYGEVLDEDTITDLLADLHHYLRASGDKNPLDTMEDCLRTAVTNFDAEVREEA